MKHLIAAPLGAAAMLALAACSPSAPETAESAADQTVAASENAAGDAMAPGGAVSAPPSPNNDAINTDANTTESALAPGSNSFTEAQARGHIAKAGYTNVTELAKSPEGLWTAKAMKDGAAVNVALDFKGAVTVQ